MEDVGDTLRFLIVGDSGLRLNGSEVFRFAKDVDVLYTAGRVATFRRLQALGHSGDAFEVGARQLIFRGLDQSGQDLLSPADIDAVVSAARQTCAARLKPDAYELVEPMLRAGIAGGQYRFCNLPAGHSLAYGVLNGGLTQGPDVLSFWRPKAQVRSIELFTDGYLTRPAGTRVRDWEREFFRVEAEDFSKSGAYAGVKGSSSKFFSDDRTVLVVHCAPPDSGTY